MSHPVHDERGSVSNGVPASSHTRILVVEDNAGQRRSIVALLQQEGFEPHGCSTGEDALRVLSAEAFGVAVVDLKLPDTDGTRLIRALLALDPNLRIIVNTAYGTFESAKELVNLGVQGLVEKAGDPGEFLRSVHAAVNDRIRAYASDLEQAVAARTEELEGLNRSLREEMAARELIELERQNSQRRYLALFRGAPSCIHEIDADGRVVAMNDAGLRMLGLDREDEVVGVPYLDLIDKEDRERVAGCLREASAGRGGSFEFRIGEGDGARYFRSRVEPCRGSDCEARIIGQTEEVTEAVKAEARRNELEQQLRHSQKLEAVGTLASGVAHDFNNVLTAILGYAELLEQSVGTASARHTVEGIRLAAEQAVEVTRALLTFSGKSSERKKPVDLEHLVADAVRLLKRMLPDSVQVRTELHANGRATIHGNSGHLNQVLMNLAVNARDAMPDGGGLVLGVTCEERDGADYGVVFVQDEGQGMSAEVRERVFEPFFTTKVRAQGTGLGLAIVHGIVKDHRGLIEVDTRAGVGTTVRVLLPIETDEPMTLPRPSVDRHPGAVGRGERILVVEDDPGVRSLVTTLLSNAGYRMLEACDGVEGLNLYSEEAVDLVIVDEDMPRMKGTTCLRELRARNALLPAVVMSGLSHFEEIRMDGATLFLRKPFKLGDLREGVADLLRSAAVPST